MIRDYIVLFTLMFMLMFSALITSYVYNVSISYFFFEIEKMGYTEMQPVYGQFYGITSLIQVVGIIAIFMTIVISIVVVVRVGFTPLGIIVAIPVYFIMIFTSLVFSNSYVYIMNVLLAYDTSFPINPYLDFMGYHLPQIITVAGAIMFVFAYAKYPKSINDGISLPSG